jgi:polyketide cyclase/dehydrase/lipid transport protein
MRPVHAVQTFEASVAEAERCWYDTTHWPRWVDGLDRVVETIAPWPHAGGCVIWQSGPAGRGRVTERVLAYAPADGQALEVSDDSVTGHQTVAFAAVSVGVQVTVRFEYRINRRSLFTPVVDTLFIRRQMTQSLGRTLAGFGARLRAERDPAALRQPGRG